MIFDFRKELGKMTPKIAKGAKVYVFGTEATWRLECKRYRNFIDMDLADGIDGFIDNDPEKQGTMLSNKLICSLNEVDLENSVILIAARRFQNEISDQLAQYGLYSNHSFFYAEVFYLLLIRWEYERMRLLKDKHKGERCFIIGNGPSLRPSDLDKLQGEYSFASNKIYLAFNQTKWRPTYFVITDPAILKETHCEIRKSISCPIFYAYNTVVGMDGFALKNEYYYYVTKECLWKPIEYAKPLFSEEPPVICWGGTVTYESLQFAAYMGFSEIYLIGIDNTYPIAINFHGELISSGVAAHFTPSYGVFPFTPRIDYMTAAYKSAREYAQQHGIKIYNATRGGKLEVFERVDFDSLF